MRGSKRQQPVVNFGGNITFPPRHHYAPESEAAVLAILNRHAHERIRAIGSLHSWSEVVTADGVLVDMRRFDRVQVERTNDELVATVGAGCRLDRLVRYLARHAGVTLPTLPAVTAQTIAGAISTGTHGSGMPSLSHYIDGVRVAAYDPHSGKARIYEWTSGPELRAARCSLGCLGILLAIRLRCVPRYSIEQRVTRVTTLDAALASEDEFPLQQTLLLPYAWTYVVYQRRPVRRTRTSAIAYLFRIYWLLCADVLFHACLVPLVNVVRRRALTRWFLKDGAPKMLWMAPPHIDDSARILVTRHELFKHLEMELIVPAAHIREAVECLQVVVSVFAGENQTIPSPWQARFERIGMLHLLDSSRGTYLHHYPLLIRRILPDDTLISMTSASQRPYYSISVFTYARDKSGMYPLARFLALAMTRLYQARLHWGKHLPVGRAELESSYPGLDAFRDVCARVDPHGVFSNSFTRQALGIDRTSPD